MTGAYAQRARRVRTAEGAATAAGPATGRPARWTIVFVLPFLLLGIAWTFSNPPSASPDEPDHLVKALGAARFDVGEKYTGPYEDIPPARRNASIARTFLIPAQLAPDHFTCTAFVPDTTAACLPPIGPTSDEGRAGETGLIERVATVGAYPMFWYVPIGWAASLGSTPHGAIYLGRLASLLLSLAFFFVGVWHLTRWLGRPAGIGLTVAVTPVAVFTASSLSTNGIEIMAAVAVAAVAVVATRHPESLADRTTLVLLTVSAVSLILSRQTGVVALAVFAVIVLLRGGGAVVWAQLRRGRPAMIVAVVSMIVAALVLYLWEREFDRPVLTGELISRAGINDYLNLQFSFVEAAVTRFGWLDTPMPGQALSVWVVLAVLLCVGALLVADRADRWTIAVTLLFAAVMAYALQAIVFTPIGGSLQGRHMLPLFSVVPLLAGVAVMEKLSQARLFGPRSRLILFAGVAFGFLHAFALFVNGRRYSVGLNGPIDFTTDPEWSPPLGWIPWLLLALAGGVWLAVNIIRSDPGADDRTSGHPVHSGADPTGIGGRASVER